MVISTSGFHATSSDHSQRRWCPSVISDAYVTFTTRSTSGNSNRCGVSASRRRGPISGSVLMISNTRSITSRNSAADRKLTSGPYRSSAGTGRSQEGRAALHEVLVDLLLDRVADPLSELEHERAIAGRLGAIAGRLDGFAELDPPARRQRDGAQRAEPGEGGRDREVRAPGEAGEERGIGDLRVDLLAADDGDGHERRAGPERDLHEAAAAEALEPVAVAPVLA